MASAESPAIVASSSCVYPAVSRNALSFPPNDCGPPRFMKHARSLDQIDASMADKLSETVIQSIIAGIPASWIELDGMEHEVPRVRTAYLRFLMDRLDSPRPFMTEALRGR